MKKIIFILLSIGVVGFTNAHSQTMDFVSGASHSGFSFSGFTTLSANQTIWIANTGVTAGRITKSSGTWNFNSVLLGTPFVGSSTDLFEITSNLGHRYTYTGATTGVKTLNWKCVTWIQFHRYSCCSGGSVGGASPDIDNVVYTIPVAPTTPTITHSPSTLCAGDVTTLSISGTLNDATEWKVYAGGCGSGTAVASTAGSSVNITASTSTTYYVRGEGCGLIGGCGNTPVTVTPVDDPTFSYSNAQYCAGEANPTPTAATTGTYTSAAGLSINSTSGLINIVGSTSGTYTVKHITSGVCPDSSTQVVRVGTNSTSTLSPDVCDIYNSPSGKTWTTSNT